MSIWLNAFNKAKQVEHEGAVLFDDIINNKSQIDSNINDIENDYQCGGFRQPLGLSRLVSAFKSLNDNNQSTELLDMSIDNLTEINKSETIEQKSRKRRIEEISCEEPSSSLENPTINSMSNQICRAWFKYTYLNIGSDCKLSTSCPRKHYIDSNIIDNPEVLYKDYSFKGLNNKQRKYIINRIRNGR